MWLAIERALNIDAAPRRFNPLKWAVTFLLVVIGWVIFRAENLHVAMRMYQAMFSFGDWQLSELGAANLTTLQIATLLLAYATLAVCGLYDFYRHPLDEKAPQAKAADGPAGEPAAGDPAATAQPGLIKALPGEEPSAVAAGPAGALVQPSSFSIDWTRTLLRAAVLALFCASLLKLSAQSYSPFLYFQF
ncbi:hypothetical protein D9M69_356820 [compost metagenome]